MEKGKLIAFTIDMAYNIAMQEEEGYIPYKANFIKLEFVNIAINILNHNTYSEEQIKDLNKVIEKVNIYE